ncbi:MAG TPA: type VI secretion system tube protein Hcp [Terriglobales bacterium]|nr:type VI secretion system tube protein Hcp [Terriglobales bacterium]
MSFLLKSSRFCVALWVAVATLTALPALAANFSITLQIAGLPGAYEGSYNALAFAWGPEGAETQHGVAPELTVTIPDDASSVTLMQSANSRQTFATADLQAVTSGLAVVSIHMTNVRIQSVHVAANIAGLYTQPVQMVTLVFDSVEYTYQPVNVIGQKNGPPVTYSATFHRNR